jgi:hypothetical protein
MVNGGSRSPAVACREGEAARQVEAPIRFRPVWMINVTITVFKYLDECLESLETRMT